jgi:1-deoxy-D-xylulose-5-phosphate reductoisomerase
MEYEVLIHPESVVHGLAEYEDGTMLAALFETDMRVPIAFALSYLHSELPRTQPGNRAMHSGTPFLDLAAKRTLSFSAPDLNRFPALRLCYQALSLGGTAPAALSAANEVAVGAYLSETVGFTDITRAVHRVMSVYQARPLECVADVYAADAWARACASNVVETMQQEFKLSRITAQGK